MREVARYVLSLVPLTLMGVLATLVIWTVLVWYTTWLVVRAQRFFRRAELQDPTPGCYRGPDNQTTV